MENYDLYENMRTISNSIGELIECGGNEKVDTITAGTIMIAGARGIQHSPWTFSLPNTPD